MVWVIMLRYLDSCLRRNGYCVVMLMLLDSPPRILPEAGSEGVEWIIMLRYLDSCPRRNGYCVVMLMLLDSPPRILPEAGSEGVEWIIMLRYLDSCPRIKCGASFAGMVIALSCLSVWIPAPRFHEDKLRRNG